MLCIADCPVGGRLIQFGLDGSVVSVAAQKRQCFIGCALSKKRAGEQGVLARILRSTSTPHLPSIEFA
jgi:hypothetical protein